MKEMEIMYFLNQIELLVEHDSYYLSNYERDAINEKVSDLKEYIRKMYNKDVQHT